MSGRPRKACSTCKLQKVTSGGLATGASTINYPWYQIRCTGEKPTCKRCIRLRHSCSYEARDIVPRSSEKPRQTTPSLNPYVEQTSLPAVTHNSTPTHVNAVGQGIYLGIPRPLISELVEIYYENVCNSTLLLHRKRFLESVQHGTVVPHTLLSVCAWGAKYVLPTIVNRSATERVIIASTKTAMGLQHSRRAASRLNGPGRLESWRSRRLRTSARISW